MINIIHFEDITEIVIMDIGMIPCRRNIGGLLIKAFVVKLVSKLFWK